MCTNFSLTTKQNDIIIGRTMELGPNLESKLFFRPVGHQFNQDPVTSFFEFLRNQKRGAEEFKLIPGIQSIEKLYTWKGKIGYMAMNGFGQDIAADGINTEGLTTGTMVLVESEYQRLSVIQEGGENRIIGENSIFYPNLSNWILSNCANCQEVIDKLAVDKLVVQDSSGLKFKNRDSKDRCKVVSPFLEVPNAMKFHFPVHDALGNNIVLEFVKGQLIVTDLGPINVLTNDPLIEWQQTNVINNYAGITPFNVQNSEGYPRTKDIGNNFTCNTFAQGTGFEGLPGSSTPVDRFVRTAMMTNFAFAPETIEEGRTLAYHILNTVDIPKGTSRDQDDESIHDFTQWATVADLKNKVYDIRMYDSPQVFRVDLMQLDLEKLAGSHMAIPVQHKSIDITKQINEKQLIAESLALENA